MRVMESAAISPKPGLSQSDKEPERFPYVLRDVDSTYPNHVWCPDITYIR